MTTLEGARKAREQFKRLTNEKPIPVEVLTRRKNPNADLHLRHLVRSLQASGIVSVLLTVIALGIPELSVSEVRAI